MKPAPPVSKTRTSGDLEHALGEPLEGHLRLFGSQPRAYPTQATSGHRRSEPTPGRCSWISSLSLPEISSVISTRLPTFAGRVSGRLITRRLSRPTNRTAATSKTILAIGALSPARGLTDRRGDGTVRENLHGSARYPQVGPGHIVGLVLLQEPVGSVGRDTQPVLAVRYVRYVDVLADGRRRVEITPAPLEAHRHREGVRLAVGAARTIVGIRGGAILDVVVEAEAHLLPRGDEPAVAAAEQFVVF